MESRAIIRAGAVPRRAAACAAAVLWAVLAVLGAPDGAAQGRSEAVGQDTLGRPLIAIFGRVHVDSLRFERVGRLEVRFTGNAGDTLKHAIITNLPRPVRPDTTYRDVTVYFEVVSAVDSLGRILEEALRRRGFPGDSLRQGRSNPP